MKIKKTGDNNYICWELLLTSVVLIISFPCQKDYFQFVVNCVVYIYTMAKIVFCLRVQDCISLYFKCDFFSYYYSAMCSYCDQYGSHYGDVIGCVNFGE